jgi:hypothetical protein
MSQAICLYRQQEHIDGPLFLGIDTHALSESAFASALEVLAANGVEVMIDERGGGTRRRRSSHTPSCATIRDGQVAWPTALSSPPRITHPRTEDSSTTPRTAALRIHT